MIIINYTTEGVPFKDSEVEDILKELAKDNKDHFLNAATINIIEMARALVAEDIINQNNILFKYEGQLEIKCSKIGRLTCEEGIPDQFDFFGGCLDRMLGLS